MYSISIFYFTFYLFEGAYAEVHNIFALSSKKDWATSMEDFVEFF